MLDYVNFWKIHSYSIQSNLVSEAIILQTMHKLVSLRSLKIQLIMGNLDAVYFRS